MQVTFCEITVEGAAARAAERTLELAEGATVEEALEAAGRVLADDEGISIHSHRANMLDVLHEGDRLEVSAGLLVDPKEARRLRAERQGDVRVVTCGRHGGRHRKAD
ncbi:RnfH family protein [Sutterella sp.]|uniref:RnfH family protein n=1 Tax=Sutterella sp. TaxID=1981025 RepID=UPI0026E001A1|nr:RnfH family protein [Sutterella sp.]MDO5532227.1 RnfH family protein [Sutterella sp.]